MAHKIITLSIDCKDYSEFKYDDQIYSQWHDRGSLKAAYDKIDFKSLLAGCHVKDQIGRAVSYVDGDIVDVFYYEVSKQGKAETNRILAELGLELEDA